MKIDDIIRQIDDNQKQIDGYGKFDEDILKKINYKFRLDWNYFSNRMEGGTLTREETRSVMVGNIDVKGKPLKDVMEMNGHDRMVLDVLKMGKGEQRISEKRIKAIHKAIMHEDDPEKVDWIGQWKTVSNHVYSYKKEKIEFTAPHDVSEKIHQLLDKTNAELDKYFKEKSARHPLEIAAQFHIDFVTIHPFYDGNGRTTRILTNLILISCGLPLIVIKDQHKQAYYQLLADVQVYGGESDLFYAFVGERVLESQGLVLAVLNGEEIEDENELDKEIQLLKSQQVRVTKKIKKSIVEIEKVINRSYIPLLDILNDILPKFNALFESFTWGCNNDSSTQEISTINYGELTNYIGNLFVEGKIPPRKIIVKYILFEYHNRNQFSLEIRIEIKFQDFNYGVILTISEVSGGNNVLNQVLQTVSLIDHPNNPIKKVFKFSFPILNYGDFYSKREIESSSKEFGLEILKSIKERNN